jgi:large subunit ribosomal protein L24
MSVRRGDTVVVTTGKDKGKKGKVLRIITKKERVVVERINMVKRHTKPSQDNPQGGIIEREGSVAVSNVMVWCEKCSKGVRTKASLVEDQKKARACTQCGERFEAA